MNVGSLVGANESLIVLTLPLLLGVSHNRPQLQLRVSLGGSHPCIKYSCPWEAPPWPLPTLRGHPAILSNEMLLDLTGTQHSLRVGTITHVNPVTGRPHI